MVTTLSHQSWLHISSHGAHVLGGGRDSLVPVRDV